MKKSLFCLFIIVNIFCHAAESKRKMELSTEATQKLLELVAREVVEKYQKPGALEAELEKLINEGADVNAIWAKDDKYNGYTVLQLAIVRDHRFAEPLLRHGANPKKKNAQGKDAVAVLEESPDVRHKKVVVGKMTMPPALENVLPLKRKLKKLMNEMVAKTSGSKPAAGEKQESSAVSAS